MNTDILASYRNKGTMFHNKMVFGNPEPRRNIQLLNLGNARKKMADKQQELKTQV